MIKDIVVNLSVGAKANAANGAKLLELLRSKHQR
jgi:hypothetical protein